MTAVLRGGPHDGRIINITDSLPASHYVRVLKAADVIPQDNSPAPILQELHRYAISSVDGNPRGPEPRATYHYAGRVS